MRFWEIDFLRGVAVILMIVFNYAFTLRYFNVFVVDAGWAFWWLFPRVIASIFIFLAGVSLILSYSRSKIKGREVYKKFIFRGLKTFSYGLLITFVTWLFFPKEFIIFGILHFIGLSIILSMLFLNIGRNKTIFFALLFIAAGIYLQGFVFDSPWLLWLGFMPHNFQTFDYFPLMPWFGVVLLGILTGNLLYPKGRRCFRFYDKISIAEPLCLIGRHSLLIYLLHQIVLIVLLYAFAGIVI